MARRRYLAVDPDNRLVADTLEADWNDALRAVQTAQDDYQRASAREDRAHRATQGRHRRARRRLLRAVVRPCHPGARAQAHRSPAHRRRHHQRTDEIHLHIRLRGGQTQSLTIPIPLNAWQARPSHPDTLALLDRLLDTHTDAETADHHQPRRPSLRHGHKPFTAAIVLHLRRARHLPSHADRLRARGLLTLSEVADRLGVHPSTKAWHRAGLLRSHKANDKNERLYEPSDPGDRRLVKRLGWRLDQREPTQPCPGGGL